MGCRETNLKGRGASPVVWIWLKIGRFRGLGGPGAPGTPFGPAPHINLHEKSGPETNSKAISREFSRGGFWIWLKIGRFRGLGCPGGPRDPLRSTGPAPHTNVHEKSAPETNSNAISRRFIIYDFLTDRKSSTLGGLGGVFLRFVSRVFALFTRFFVFFTCFFACFTRF